MNLRTKDTARGRYRYCKIKTDGTRTEMSPWCDNLMTDRPFMSSISSIDTTIRDRSMYLYENVLLINTPMEQPVVVSGGQMSWASTSPGPMNSRVSWGDIIAWGDGSFSYVTGSSSTVANLTPTNDIFTSENKTSQVPTVWRTSGNAYSAWGTTAPYIASKETSAVISSTYAQATDTYDLTISVTFTAVTSNKTARAMQIYQWSIMNLPSEVELLTGEQLYLEYNFQYVTGQYETVVSNMDAAEGVPLEWNITSITADGTDLTIVKDDAYDFVQGVGDSIKLVNTRPRTSTIVNITDNGTSFTVFTNGGLDMAVSDSILIAGSSVSGYNGTWTVDSITADHTFSVLATTGLGNAGSSGTARRSVGGDFYDGTYVVSSVVDTDTLKLASTDDFGNGEGTASIAGTVTMELGYHYQATPPSDKDIMEVTNTLGNGPHVYYSATTPMTRNATTYLFNGDADDLGMTLLTSTARDIVLQPPSAANGMVSRIGCKLRTTADISFKQVYVGSISGQAAPSARGVLFTFSETQHKLPGFITELYHERRCYPKPLEGLL